MDKPRILELDGLRGVAACAVVIAHYFGELRHGLHALTIGWMGVDVFFVLSGFLIGTIILENSSTPGFFKVFYIKRAARILPVYAAVCLLTLCLAKLTQGHAWSDVPFPPGVYAAFGQNVAIPLWGGGGKWLLPTWTLAVEERFYLVLPLLVYFAPRRWLTHILIALWFCAPLFRWAIHGVNPMAALTLLPSRMDLLLSGVLAAMLQAQFDMTEHLRALRITPLVCVLLLLGTAIASRLDTHLAAMFTVLNPSLLGIAAGAFLLAAVNGAPEGARYRSPVLRYFGQISYALYLVHQPISGLLHGLILDKAPDTGTPAQFAVSLLAVICSVGVAAASWRWLEKPCLAWGRTYRFAGGWEAAPAPSESR